MKTKQVIVIRKDLNMRKGKMVAQGAHASMKVFFDLMECPDSTNLTHFTLDVTQAMAVWMSNSFTKVCVGVDSEQELLQIHENAKLAGLRTSLIQDAGHTEFGGVPTYTAVAVGPAASEDVDVITEHLKLL